MLWDNFHHLSDEALLAYYHSSRNTRAFHLLYQRHKDSLYRYCSQMNAAGATQILEELWKKILEKPPQMYGRMLHSWLFINANKLLNALSDKEIQNSSMEDVANANTLSALQQLPRIERNIFLLHVECNLPLATVADIERISLHRCREHYRACKQQLETILHGPQRRAWHKEIKV